MTMKIICEQKTAWFSIEEYWDECEGSYNAFINFEVSMNWLEKWFEANCKGQDTNGFINKDTYETLEDWFHDYVLDDLDSVFEAATIDNAILTEEHMRDGKIVKRIKK